MPYEAPDIPTSVQPGGGFQVRGPGCCALWPAAGSLGECSNGLWTPEHGTTLPA